MWKLTIGVLIMSAMVIRANELDRAYMSEVYQAICVVESGDTDYNTHPDGISHGRSGATIMALRECQRLGKLPKEWNEEDLTNPDVSYIVGYVYLEIMFERNKSWWKAVAAYHGSSDKAENEDYANRVFNILTTRSKNDKDTKSR